MGITDLDPTIRIKLILFLVLYLSITFIFSSIMRNYLEVKKRKGFLRKYVSEQHKKIDQILTGVFIALMVAAYFYETRILNGTSWFFTPSLILLGSVVVNELVRAYMEWKYSDDKNDYILTLSELFFAFALVGIAFASNFLGLFR